MTLALFFLFTLGIGAIGAGVGYGYGHLEGVSGTDGYRTGYLAALAHVRAVKFRSVKVHTEVPADYAVESIQLGAYQMLTDRVCLPTFDGAKLSGVWVVGQGARLTVWLRCLRTGVLRVQTSEREEETTLP